MSRRILHIDLDAFFVSVEELGNPSLRGKPVVVGGRPGERGVVAAASYPARRFGLHSGMSLLQAVRLCPQAIFIDGNFSLYRQASAAFMSVLAEFVPVIEPMGLDEAFLDITGFDRQYGSYLKMGAALKKRVKEVTGLVVSVGIASGKVVAKVASDESKPDGLLEVAEGEEARFLARLPVAKLPGIGRRGEQVLSKLGVRTIGELAGVPVVTLRHRLGAWAEVIHQHANGIDLREVEPPAAAKSISRSTTFRTDTWNRNELEATLRYLSERVGASLRQEGNRARVVTLKLRYADFTTLTRSQTLLNPVADDESVFLTGQAILEKQLKGQRQAVRLVGIGVSQLVFEEGQMSLLETPAERWLKIDRAVDKIRLKYGFRAIETGQTRLLRDVFPADDAGSDSLEE